MDNSLTGSAFDGPPESDVELIARLRIKGYAWPEILGLLGFPGRSDSFSKLVCAGVLSGQPVWLAYQETQEAFT